MENDRENIRLSKGTFTEWLEKLQQESWQLELLISGLALFGIWESQYFLQRLEEFIQVESLGYFRLYLEVFLWVLQAGWAIFLVNLVIHIIVRGFWIGAIGLRYVSGDIDYDSLNYSERFTNYFQRRVGDFDDYIEKIERFSSVIFSFTFLLFFLFLSFILFNAFFAVIAQIVTSFLSEENHPLLGFFGMFYYGLGLLLLIDFLSLGVFKKIRDKTVSGIFYYIYRFYSTISLSFLFRPLLLNFIDNKYTRNLFFLAIPYILLIIFGSQQIVFDRYPLFPDFDRRSYYHSHVTSNAIDWHFYDDMREAHLLTYSRNKERPNRNKIHLASLHAYEIEKGKTGKLFLEYREYDENRLKGRNAMLTPFRKKDLRLKLFSSNQEKDSIDAAILKKEVKELRILRQANRKDKLEGYTDQKDIELFESFKQTIEDQGKRCLECDIEKKYKDLRHEHYKEKIETTVELLRDLNTIRINGKKWNEQLDCSFYIHPNMHERGLLCYFETDSLTIGKNFLEVDRGPCKDCHNEYLKIPFRLVR